MGCKDASSWKKEDADPDRGCKHNVGVKEGLMAAQMEIRMLLEDYESRNNRL